MSCAHKFVTGDKQDYGQCVDCGTYHSLAALDPKDIYTKGYWSEKWGHSNIEDQNWNCDVHKENGLTKNEFVLGRIWTQDRSAVLEIGCAPGSLLGHLKRKCEFENVHGNDADPEYMDDIFELAGFKDCLLKFGLFPDCTKKHHAKEFYSLIIALDVFEHSPRPKEFLDECRRLLKPDGQLLLMLPLVKKSEFLDERFFDPREHVYLHSMKHMNQLLADAGFEGAAYSQWCNGHDVVTARRL